MKNLVAGRYSFALSVTDNSGASASDTVIVDVKMKNTISSVALTRNTYAAISYSVKAEDNETPGIEQFTVYPNPAVHFLNTRLSSASTGKLLLNIYNINGIKVQSATFEKPGILFEENVNVSTLQAGVFYIEYKFNDGGSVTLTFVKH